MPPSRPPLFAPFPTTGVWTAVGLSRAEFLGILALSTVVFLVAPTPVWTHLHDGHLTRLALSYAVIPLTVGVALARRGRFRVESLLIATLMLSLLKLVLTTTLLMACALVRS